MPARTDAESARQEDLNFGAFDDLYNDFDPDDDPFASEPESSTNKKKRKEPTTDDLGITEEVEVKKRAIVPRVKLDEQRLLSDNGIPKLRKRAAGLKLKGKGHEFSDAKRLLSFYQLWLDDLFPKAKFLDALAMVEKAGHKTTMQKMRVQWIEEGKPKRTSDDPFDADDMPEQQEAPAPTRIAPIFEQQRGERPTTPRAGDPFGDEDIYNATPVARTSRNTGDGGGQPDDDDLDALMAEAEAQQAPAAPVGSLFGSGVPRPAAREPPVEDFDDDLDAMMAEAEADTARGAEKTSSKTGNQAGNRAENGRKADDFDDLDDLIAEAEAQPKAQINRKPTEDNFEDEEAAMAEMDGLW